MYKCTDGNTKSGEFDLLDVKLVRRRREKNQIESKKAQERGKKVQLDHSRILVRSMCMMYMSYIPL